MKWRKLGRVYTADGRMPWAMSHAFLPTPMMRDDRRLRVYVAFVDSERVGRIGFVEVDAANPLRVLAVSERPVLDIGVPGTFDDSGVTPMSLVEYDGKKLLYYAGWQRGVRVRYCLFVGLAISEDGGDEFQRLSQAPILDRSDQELFIRTAAHVRRESGTWRMWYVGGSHWLEVNGKSVPSYNLRYLESVDGVTWGKQGAVCMDPNPPDEYGFGRPFVCPVNGRYTMSYSIRTKSKGYRLGHAESPDGRSWQRKDEAVGIDVSSDGWDSEMICFSAVVEVLGKTYLFYNGNNYGATGFGVAVRDE